MNLVKISILFGVKCFFTATIKKNMGSIIFHRYSSSPDVIRMRNNGKTVIMDLGYPKIRLNDNSDSECGENVLISTHDWPYVTGGGLNGTYQFHQLHFHWGSRDATGSEHSVSCKISQM